MSDQAETAPGPQTKTFEQWATDPAVKAALADARAQWGENLAGVLSAWGPFIVVHKPTFEQELAFYASKQHQSPTQQMWGSVKLVENCLIYPDHEEFSRLRERHGFLFVDNISAFIVSTWAPEGKSTEAKKL